jgi:DNA polymerase I
MMNKDKIVIIDGNSLMNRAFYALPPLTNSKGVHTNAVYGFTTMLLKIINEVKPKYIVSAFDRKAPTFRHLEYADYKTGRKKMPPELGEQFPIVKEVLKTLGINMFEIDGFEADDIIGTVSKKCGGTMDVIIYTGDRDALQLVSDSVKVAITKKGITDTEIYDEKAIQERYEATPKQFIDIKGLMGDSSDNIPGVPGIGEKTAVKLIKEFGSVEGVIQNAGNISAKKVKELIGTYADQAVFSKKLATIVTDVPIDFNIDDLKVGVQDRERAVELFKEYEFKTLIDKIPAGDNDVVPAAQILEYGSADSERLKELIEDIKSSGEFSMALSIKGTDYNNADIDGMAISLDGKDAVYIPPDHELLGMLRSVIEDEKIEKIGHNAKDAFVSLYKHGIDLKGLRFDTAIASYLLNPSESTYNIDELARKFLDETIPSEKEIKESIKSSSNEKLARDYLCTKAVYIYKLHGILEEQLKENNMTELYNAVEHPLIEVLASMEILGFTADKNMLHELSIEFGKEIDTLTGEIYSLAGQEFNINSPKQLGFILFEKLNLPVIKKTKTGYSTDAEVLEKLAPQHDIVDKILQYRQIMKLKSTYVDGLLNIIGEDNKIHSSFNQTVTATGRISSTEPNLQNIPIKLEIGRRIRKVFVPSSQDYYILSADYSQIELRVLAHIAHDKNLIDAFFNKLDIHRKTASEVFNVPVEEVTSLMRSRAKAVNFGIVYGISDFGLSRDLGISRKEAKTYIDNYLNKYSGVREYMNNIVEDAKKYGYVTTIMNRKRFIPELTSSNFNVRSLGERLAMNTPIQGSAADIIKVAMVKVYNSLKDKHLKSRLILQVHDELILEVYKDEIDEVTKIVKDDMELAIRLDVPLEADVNTGSNWFEAK